MKLKQLTIAIVFFAISNLAFANNNFELLESIPKATIYGQPGITHIDKAWLKMINNAKKTIDMGAFYIASKKDGPMYKAIMALKHAAARGVKVRIILDGSFYKQDISAIKPIMNVKNIEIRRLPMNLIAGGIMHAKYLIIDNSNCYVGSANFDWRALEQIHEIGVRINNKRLATTIEQIFNLDWKLCEAKSINANQKLLFQETPIYPVTSERPIIIKTHGENLIIHPAFSPKTVLLMGFDWEQTQLVNLINNARRQILIQVLTYSPAAGFNRKGYWPTIDNALRAAAGRGVKVKLIVSNWSLRKSALSFLKSLELVPNIDVKYSAIPEYKNKFIPYARVEHCKYMVIDNDISWVGTGNWQWSYFNNTRNIAIIINGKYPNKQLQDIFFRDWSGPYTHIIDPDKKYFPPKNS